MKDTGRLFLSIAMALLFVVIFTGPAYGQEPAAETTPDMAEPDALPAVKTVENCEKAIKGYDALLKDDPDNVDLLFRIADAYVGIIDIKTAALRIEKDEFKPMLKDLGKKAYDYAMRAYKLAPKDKRVLGSCIVAYGYWSASFGIVKAILKGAAGRYKDLCNELNAVDETYLGGLGHRSLGKLYEVAPWPVGSKKKALAAFKKAVEIDDTVLFSRYYLGLLYYGKKDYDAAKKEFTYVRDAEPPDHEKHYIGDYKKSARFYVRMIERMKKK